MLDLLKLIPLASVLLLLPACDDKPKENAGAKTEKKAGDAKAGDAKAGDAKADAEPKGPPLPALDTGKAKGAVEAMASMAEAERPLLAANALAELERERLGASFVEGLEALVGALPDQRATLLAKSIQANIAMLDAACAADGAKTMQSLATMAADTRDAALWDACKFEDLGLMKREDAKGTDAVAILVAHMAFAKLEAHGEVDPSERALLLALTKIKTDAD